MTSPISADKRAAPKYPDAAVSAAEFSSLSFDTGGIKKMNVKAAAQLIAGMDKKSKGSLEITGAKVLEVKRKLDQGKTPKGLDATQAAYLRKHIDGLEGFLRDYGQWFRADKTNETFCWSFDPAAVPNKQLRDCATIVADAFGDTSILNARDLKTAADLLGWSGKEATDNQKSKFADALKKLEAAVADKTLDPEAFEVVDMFVQTGRPPLLQWDKLKVNGSREFDLLYALPVAGDKAFADMSSKDKAALVADYEDRFTHLGYDRIYVDYGDKLLLALNPSGSLSGKNAVRARAPVEVRVGNTWDQKGEVLFVKDTNNSVLEAGGRFWGWLADKVFTPDRNIDAFTEQVYSEMVKKAGKEPSKDGLKDLVSGPTVMAGLVGISWKVLTGLAVGVGVGTAASTYDIGKYLLTHQLDLRLVYDAIGARVRHDGPIKF